MTQDSPHQKRFAGALRVLFVCTGNTCRSPMAEAIARRLARERGWEGLEVRSAGVAAFEGQPASGGAVRAAASRGLDLRGHQARYLSPDVAAWADVILVMSPMHLVRVAELGAGDRAALLTAFAEGAEGGDGAGVPDPIGGPDEEYLRTFERLETLIARAMDRLAEEYAAVPEEDA